MAWRRFFRKDASFDDSAPLVREVERFSLPLDRREQLDPLFKRIGDARYVLLGEASHGTSEYYTWRTAISRRLIETHGFNFIAVEGDWPDCYRVNRYMKAFPGAEDNARDVLHNFERWPTWMWANHEVLDLVRWLRSHNESVPEDRKVGFYGLDVYSLWDSLYQVMGYLRRSRPEFLAAAQRAFGCFEPYGEDVQEYAQATQWLDASCENEVAALLSEIRRSAKRYAQDGREAQFDAEQNALVIANAEHYYRTMVHGGPESWNIRDRHMVDTLQRLMEHHGPKSKGIVWEHNTHIGDARYTDMVDDGTINVGQLVREQHSRDGVVLVGFGSHRGSVIAGRAWEAPMEEMKVPPAQDGSWEDVLHQAGDNDKLLIFSEKLWRGPFAESRGHRAIGVVYHPDREWGNYVPTVLPKRYDAFLYIDQSTALRPLHEVQPHEEHEVPETYPSGV